MGSSSSKNIIGIDLGTEYCCVGTFKNEKIEIVKNRKGNKTTPSYVALAQNGKWLVGEDAKNQAVENPINTVFDVKRLIGRRFDDPEVQDDMKSYWPYNVINVNGRPKIEFVRNGEKSYFYPEEIVSKLLIYMKEIAGIFLGDKVKHAVIAVPVNFNETQRQMTIDAAKIAELEVLELVNEPTASCLAYSYDRFVKTGDPIFEKHIMLVFDLGGGTLDLSLIEIINGKARTIGSCGDTHLGGNDFNQRMIVHLLESIKENYKKDLSGDKDVRHLLNIQCEKAKIDLSNQESITIGVKINKHGIDESFEITREKFEDLNKDLFGKIMDVVNRALTHRFCKFSPIYHPIFDQEVYSKLTEGEQNPTIINALEKIKIEKEKTTRLDSEYFSAGRIEVIESDIQDSAERKQERISEYIKSIEQYLDNTRMEIINSYCHKKNIDGFILIGGSSKIPKIKELLNSYFSKDSMDIKNINPDEIVAYGATIKALMSFRDFKLNSNRPKVRKYSERGYFGYALHSVPRLGKKILPTRNASSNNESNRRRDLDNSLITTIAPLKHTHSSSLLEENLCFKESVSMSIGIENAYGEMDKLIAKNQSLPISFTKVYEGGLKIDTTKNKTDIIIKVYQGEKEYVKDNYFVGELKLSNIKLPLKLQVKLQVNEDNSFKIQLQDLSKWFSKTNETTLTNWEHRIDESTIERIMNDDSRDKFLDSERISHKNVRMLNYRELSQAFEKSLHKPIELDETFIEKIEKLNEKEKLDVEFDFPFSDCSNTRVTQIELIKIINSNAKPRFINCLPMNKKLLFKKGDNLYDDQTVIAFLDIFNRIWAYSNAKFKWNRDGIVKEEFIFNKCYKVIPFKEPRLKCGFIEPVDGEAAEDLWDNNNILRTAQHKFSDLSNSLRPGGDDFVRLIASAIGTFVSMFILAIGDRHQGNLMLANDHSLFNIDFGYSFGETPKFDTGDFPVPFFVRNYLAENKIRDSFTNECWNAFKILADYQDLFEFLAAKYMQDKWKDEKAKNTFRKSFSTNWFWFACKMYGGSYFAIPKQMGHQFLGL